MAIHSTPKPQVTEQELRIPNIDVLGPRVLVQPYTPPAQTQGGIIIPVQAQERQQRGIVLVPGEGIVTERGDHIPCPVRPGQHILYARFGGAEIEIEDEFSRKQRYLIIMQSDIYCVLFPELTAGEVEKSDELCEGRR